MVGAIGALSCGDSEGRDGQLLEAQRRESAETERLRKLQTFRYFDETNKVWIKLPNVWKFTDAGVFDWLSGSESDNSWCSNANANSRFGWRNLYKAKVFAQIAGTESVFRFDDGASVPHVVVVPPQPLTTRVDLYIASRYYARNAITELLGAYNIGEKAYGATWWERLNDNCGSEKLWEYVPRLLREALELYDDVSLKAAELSVKAGDALAARAASKAEGNAWRFSAALYSRASAAHLLLGGVVPGWQHSVNVTPFCSSSRLTPGATLALKYLRQAGQSPADILSGSISTDTLLNGAKARLAVLLQRPDLTDNEVTLQEVVGVTTAEFEQARAYLREEITQLNRSRSATLPLVADGQLYPQYAGVASQPKALPGIVWSAMAAGGVGTTQNYADVTQLGQFPSDLSSINTAEYYNRMPSPAELGSQMYKLFYRMNLNVHAHDAYFFETYPNDWLKFTSPILNALSRQNAKVDGKVRVRNDGEGVAGRVAFELYQGGKYDPSKLFVVEGEDALRCALDGNIEGALCNLEDYKSVFTKTITSGITTEAPYSSPIMWTGTLANVERFQFRRLYLIDGSSGTNQPAFGIEVFFNTQALTMGAEKSADIVPTLNAQVAKYVALDAGWCGQTEFDCNGFRFDERIPLENSLATDSDPMESSWSYYLNRAKTAAEEARARGEEYFRAGLEFELRKEGNWQLAHSAELQAAAAIDEVQSICGSGMDPRKLIKLLKENSTEGDLDSICGDSKQCVDSIVTIAQRYPKDPDMSRLVECLDPGTIRPFISPGTNALCVWVDKENDNKVCEGATRGFPCPTRATAGADGPSCAAMAIPNDNSKAALPIAGEDLLKYFIRQTPSPAGLAQQAQKVCKYVRDLRYGTAIDGGTVVPKDDTEQTFDRAVWWQRIVDSHFFDSTNLKAMATQGIGLKLRPRNNFELTFNGETVWSTGDIGVTASTASGMWPCGSSGMPEDCISGRGGFFCKQYNCNDPVEREKLVSRMRAAVEFALAGGISPGAKFNQPEYMNGIPGGYIDVPFSPSEVRSETITNDSIWGRSEQKNPFYWDCGAFTDFAGTGTSGIVDRSFAGDLGLSWSRCDSSTESVGFDDNSWVNSRNDTNDSSQIHWWVAPGSSELWTWSATEKPSGWDGAGLYISSANARNRQRWFDSYLYRPYMFYLGLKGVETVAGGLMRPGNVGYSDFWAKVNQTKDAPTFVSTSDRSNGLARKLLVTLAEPVVQQGPCRWDDETQGPSCRAKGLSTVGVIDALELSCQVMASKGGSCSFNAPPQMGNATDMASAQRYLSCLADSLETSAGDMVFARVPERVRDVLAEEGGTGAFPASGGQYGAAISRLRGAFIDLADMPGAVAFEVRQLASAVEQINTARKLLDVQNEMVDVQGQMTLIDTMMNIASSANIFSPGSYANAVTALAKLDLSNQLSSLQKKANELDMDLKLQELGDQLSQRARTLQTYATRINDAAEEINTQLAELESLRLQAGRKVAEALRVAQYQAPNSEGIDNAYAWNYEEAKRQYDVANNSAIQAAVLARKAIEQRLGVNLEEMTQELPLVNAPSSWVNEICQAKGIDFEGILEADADSENSQLPFAEKPMFLGHYIGEYVSKLEKTVESYRQEYPFADGADEAIISVRDDLQKVSATCSVTSPNLFPNSSGIASGTAPGTPGAGWHVEGCPTVPDGDNDDENDVPYACLMVNAVSGGWKVDGQTLPLYNFDYSFDSCEGIGCSREYSDSTATLLFDPSVATSVWLDQGYYYVSVYAHSNRCAVELNVRDATGNEIETYFRYREPEDHSWGVRKEWRFTIAAPGQYDLAFGLEDPSCAVNWLPNVVIGGPMLHKVSYASYSEFSGLVPYAKSDADGMWSIPACKDSEGNAFQKQGWARKCIRLCRSGYGESCKEQVGQEECFHELRFRLDDVLLENGLALQAAGFAKGNYNYRVDQVAVNFVGTGIRNCDSSETEAACASNASVHYSLEHKGPFFTRNYLGDDVQSLVYDGRIEQARGLAAERYLTNPLSSADRTLMDAYIRSEMQGWPLSGEYVLKVWDSQDVKFENIDDVQIYLKYRYWTRLK